MVAISNGCDTLNLRASMSLQPDALRLIDWLKFKVDLSLFFPRFKVSAGLLLFSKVMSFSLVKSLTLAILLGS